VRDEESRTRMVRARARARVRKSESAVHDAGYARLLGGLGRRLDRRELENSRARELDSRDSSKSYLRRLQRRLPSEGVPMGYSCLPPQNALNRQYILDRKSVDERDGNYSDLPSLSSTGLDQRSPSVMIRES
jgi:hypothetical protein